MTYPNDRVSPSPSHQSIDTIIRSIDTSDTNSLSNALKQRNNSRDHLAPTPPTSSPVIVNFFLLFALCKTWTVVCKNYSLLPFPLLHDRNHMQPRMAALCSKAVNLHQKSPRVSVLSTHNDEEESHRRNIAMIKKSSLLCTSLLPQDRTTISIILSASLTSFATRAGGYIVAIVPVRRRFRCPVLTGHRQYFPSHLECFLNAAWVWLIYSTRLS